MFSEAKVTEIYCMANDFCKEFAKVQEKYMVEDKNHRHRNKPNRMNDAEIMVILILFHSGGFRCFKHYYKEIFTLILFLLINIVRLNFAQYCFEMFFQEYFPVVMRNVVGYVTNGNEKKLEKAQNKPI